MAEGGEKFSPSVDLEMDDCVPDGPYGGEDVGKATFILTELNEITLQILKHLPLRTLNTCAR